jgi:hypothetical protein
MIYLIFALNNKFLNFINLIKTDYFKLVPYNKRVTIIPVISEYEVQDLKLR